MALNMAGEEDVQRDPSPLMSIDRSLAGGARAIAGDVTPAAPTSPSALQDAWRSQMAGNVESAKTAQAGALTRLRDAHSEESPDAESNMRWGSLASALGEIKGTGDVGSMSQALARAGGAYGSALQQHFAAQKQNKIKSADLEFQDAGKRLTGLETAYQKALLGQGRNGRQTIWRPVPGKPGMVFNSITSESKYIPPAADAQADEIYKQAFKQGMVLDPANAMQYAADKRDEELHKILSSQNAELSSSNQTSDITAANPGDLTKAQWISKLRAEGKGSDADAIESASIVGAKSVKPATVIQDKRSELAGNKAKSIAEAKTAAGSTPEAINLLRTKSDLKVMHGVAALNEDQKEVLTAAMLDGRVDPNRVNSKTAPLLADALLRDPKADLSKLSADISLARNPGFRQKTIVADTLPEVMDKMVELGKKVGFSDVSTVGKMQAAIKGELNDPDYTEYLTLRNDALMEIAGVMRGVGMTDQAHRAEIEAAKPTMSPQALDAWLRAQTSALKPRLDRYRRVTKDPDIGTPRESTTKSTSGSDAAADKRAKRIAELKSIIKAANEAKGLSQ